MYPYHTSWQRLYEAVQSLCSAEPSIQKRLAFALQDLALLRAEDCPGEVWEKIAKAQLRQLDFPTDVSSLSEDSIAAWCNTLSPEGAYEVAKQIVSAYDVVAREYCSKPE